MLGIQVVMTGSFQAVTGFTFHQLLSFFVPSEIVTPRRAWHRPTKAAIPSPRPWRRDSKSESRMSERFNMIPNFKRFQNQKVV